MMCFERKKDFPVLVTFLLGISVAWVQPVFSMPTNDGDAGAVRRLTAPSTIQRAASACGVITLAVSMSCVVVGAAGLVLGERAEPIGAKAYAAADLCAGGVAGVMPSTAAKRYGVWSISSLKVQSAEEDALV